MGSSSNFFTVVAFSLSVLCGASFATDVIAFREVTVLPMTGKVTLKNQTVIISDSYIQAIGRAKEVRIPAGSIVVEDSAGTLDVRRQYVSDRLLEVWREQVVDRRESFTPNLTKHIESSLRNLREMHAEGVLIYPGFSLHDEVIALADQVGMTPLDALLSATRYSAAFLGYGDSLGTIEAGKEADIVLLEGNPLDDLRNLSRISAVVSRGRLFDRAALDRMLAEVAGERHAG